MHVMTLPPTIDRTTAGALVASFDAAMTPGASLLVEGRDVTRIGQSGLQLLLSAQITAQARGASLQVRPSEMMEQAARLAGLDGTFIWIENNHDQ